MKEVTDIAKLKEIQGILRRVPTNSTAIQDHRSTIPTIDSIADRLPHSLWTRYHPNNPHQ